VLGARGPALLQRARQAFAQARLAALDARVDEAGAQVALQRCFVAVLDHQRDAVTARGGDQLRAMRLCIAHFQRVLQRHALQALRQLGHQCRQCCRIGRVPGVELPEQGAQSVTECQRGLQERRGSVDRAAQIAPLHQVARRFHRKAEALRRLRGPLRALRFGGGAIEGAVDLDAAQGAAGMGQLLALRQAGGIEHATAPLGKYPAADAAADRRRGRCRCHWPWSARHGS